MKGHTDLLSLKLGTHIHFDDNCKHTWRVITSSYNSSEGTIVQLQRHTLFSYLTEADSFHYAKYCPHAHVSSPFTTNRTYYKPPTKLQAR